MATYEITTHKGFPVTTLSCFAREGYVLLGWNTIENRESETPQYNVNQLVQEGFQGNENLYACWGKILSVEFDGNGGGTPQPTHKEVIYGKQYGTLATCSKTGHVFNGWYTQQGNQINYNTIVTQTENHTLCAHWTQIDDYLKNDANDYIGNNYRGLTSNQEINNVTIADSRVATGITLGRIIINYNCDVSLSISNHNSGYNSTYITFKRNNSIEKTYDPHNIIGTETYTFTGTQKNDVIEILGTCSGKEHSYWSVTLTMKYTT